MEAIGAEGGCARFERPTVRRRRRARAENYRAIE
jgi:hypothetical protein